MALLNPLESMRNECPEIGHVAVDRSDRIETIEEPTHKLHIYAVFQGEFHGSLSQRLLTSPGKLHQYGAGWVCQWLQPTHDKLMPVV